jgi:hypothetical protein
MALILLSLLRWHLSSTKWGSTGGRVDNINILTMRKLLRSAPFSQMARAAVPEYRPEANDLKFKNWWSRLNSLSSKPASKVYLAQLSNLFAYYNRQVADTTKVLTLPSSLSTSRVGGARSSRKVWWTLCRGAMRIWQRRSTIWTRCSTISFLRIRRRLTIL